MTKKQLTDKDRTVNYKADYGYEGFKVNNMMMRKEGDGAVLIIDYTSTEKDSISVFIPPDDILQVVEGGIEKGEHQLEIRFTAEEIRKLEENSLFAMRVHFEEPDTFLALELEHMFAN